LGDGGVVGVVKVDSADVHRLILALWLLAASQWVLVAALWVLLLWR
jgi:hypothetical protein